MAVATNRGRGHAYICMVVVTARDRLEFMATGRRGRSGIGSWGRRRLGQGLSCRGR